MDEDVFFDEFAQVRTAMSLLPERDEHVLKRAYLDGLSQDEIARELNITPMHVSRLQRRALSSLREILEQMQRGEA